MDMKKTKASGKELKQQKIIKLPRQLKKREADITPLVLKWFEQNWGNSCLIEVKIGDGKVKPHQEAALRKTNDGVFSWKMPDMGNRNCADAFFLRDADACVVRCTKRLCYAEFMDGRTVTFLV